MHLGKRIKERKEDYYNLQRIIRPAALSTRVTCRIHRCRDGLDKLYPQYHLFIEHLETGEIHHVMTARKKRKSNTSYYTITGIYRENLSVPEGYVELGKVRYRNYINKRYSAHVSHY